MIKLDNVTYSYGGAALFHDISLQLDPGGFYFLTGPSGAGKTTLMRLCYGALRPQSGQIDLFGKLLSRLDRDGIARTRRRIGVVHQDCTFLDHMSVAENVALPLMVAGTLGPEHNRDLADLLAWVGLEHRKNARPPELSGGERQRLALARAVIGSPDIVLADEPTGNVDWDMSQRLLQLLVELNRMGKTILVATHDLMLIRAAKSHVAARVIRIADGRLQTSGVDL